MADLEKLVKELKEKAQVQEEMARTEGSLLIRVVQEERAWTYRDAAAMVRAAAEGDAVSAVDATS